MANCLFAGYDGVVCKGKLAGFSRFVCVLLTLCGVTDLQARTPRHFSVGTNLNDGNSYSPPGESSSADDIHLTTNENSLTMIPGATILMGSLNQTNALNYTISNQTSGSTNSFLNLGASVYGIPGANSNSISPQPTDLIYLGGPNSVLTLQGVNGGSGSGTLTVGIYAPGTINVAEPGAILNISARLVIDYDGRCCGPLTKTGRGTLNFSNTFEGLGANSATFRVDGGTTNFASGSGGDGLDVSNLNSGPGSAVTVNMSSNVRFSGLDGTIAFPSSGTNTATVNLVGPGTILTLGGSSHRPQHGDCAAVIAGQGGLSLVHTTQEFSGNNTYAGETRVNEGGSIQIDGVTLGQGSYIVGGYVDGLFNFPAFLRGSGQIGLAPGASVLVNAYASIAPGPIVGGVGTLRIMASGGVGVRFNTNASLSVRLGSGGTSDVLAIEGGAIDLTAPGTKLQLVAQPGAFDGHDYTIATFPQNVNGGTFQTVSGLPTGYAVQYNPTSIKVVGVVPSTFGNISTRTRVETADNVLIGGFIVTGTEPKRVIVRAVGPSLPVPGKLDNPTLELHGPRGLIASNDDWREASNRQEIMDSQLAPSSDFESAILTTLPANGAGYTAIVRGANGATGVGLVEVYDLDRTVDSQLGNISSRGFVQTGDNVMIGGFIVVGTTLQKVIVRAVGPSLEVAEKLADPTLELYNRDGVIVAANDNWRSDQEAEIISTGLAPRDDLEPAIVTTLTTTPYTAIIRGKDQTTGVALVEVYAIN